MSNLLIWNMRGLWKKGKLPLLNILIKEHNVGVICILEVKSPGSEIVKLASRTNLRHHFQSIDNPKIWILWNEDTCCSDFRVSDQSITFKMQTQAETKVVSAIYASCDMNKRRDLWDHLQSLDIQPNVPWILGGDYNTIANMDKKKGGVPPDRTAMEDFKNFQNTGALHDMGYEGSIFTWASDNPRDMIWERLDRVL